MNGAYVDGEQVKGPTWVDQVSLNLQGKFCVLILRSGVRKF